MKHELLAPAGSMDIFYAVIRAGADAVYIGGPKFGARAYAPNFSQEEILSAILYAHLHGVKVYMTVNTLVKNHELDECIRMMVPFYEAGLDGVILQDMGVLRAFSRHFPDMQLHASTQMSVSNVDGAKLLKNAGVTRVVTSRELSLKEIKDIREMADIEVECFIHGALCYSYSGQCLMSSMIGGRSGNRGRCAQPCRLAYEVLQKDGTVRKPASNILSLKDLCTIEFLPDILEAGVDSLKIEGRMKQASYAYTVVSVYRKYLDMYEKYGRKGYHVEKEDYRKLLDAGNREGFTDGYFFAHNGQQMLTLSASSHNSSDGEMDETVICKPVQLPVQAHGFFHKDQPAFLRLQLGNTEISVEGMTVLQAKSKGMEEEKIRSQLNKTGNTFVYFKELTLDTDPDIFLPVSEINQLRRNAIQQLYQALCKNRIYQYHPETLKQSIVPKRPMTASVLVNEPKQLALLLDKDYIGRVYIELFGLKEEEIPACREFLEDLKKSNKEIYGAFPFVLRKSGEPLLEKRLQQFGGTLDGVLVRSYDGLSFALRHDLPFIADEMLYTYSDEAVRMLLEQKSIQDTIPYELSEREIAGRFNGQSEWVLYGYLPVMVSAGCVYKNTGKCDQKSGFLFLKDRKNYQFPVRNECNGCYNIIYNSTPTCLFNTPLNVALYGVQHVRLQFTTESASQMKAVFSLFEKNVLGHPIEANPLKEFTWGHFKKGVL